MNMKVKNLRIGDEILFVGNRLKITGMAFNDKDTEAMIICDNESIDCDEHKRHAAIHTKCNEEFEVLSDSFRPFVQISNFKDDITNMVLFVCQALNAVGQDGNSRLLLHHVAYLCDDYVDAVHMVENFVITF